MAFSWQNTTPVSVRDVRSWLKDGRKVALYIRHAERPAIDPSDKTFGAALVLTPRGHEAALRLGCALRGVVQSIQLKASPMQRTRRTAQVIADGAGMGEDLCVTDSDEISVRNIFLDPASVHETMGSIGVMKFMLDYIETGHGVFCRPVPEATRLALQYIKRDANAQLNIYCGHDFMIAAALCGMRLAHFTAETWIPFLTGMALAQNQDGTWECRWFV